VCFFKRVATLIVLKIADQKIHKQQQQHCCCAAVIFLGCRRESAEIEKEEK
jgi:hypothetical protein